MPKTDEELDRLMRTRLADLDPSSTEWQQLEAITLKVHRLSLREYIAKGHRKMTVGDAIDVLGQDEHEHDQHGRVIN